MTAVEEQETETVAVEEVAKKRGRPPKYGNRALTDAERQRLYKKRLEDKGGISFRLELKEPEMVKRLEAFKKAKGLSSNKAAGEVALKMILSKIKLS